MALYSELTRCPGKGAMSRGVLGMKSWASARDKKVLIERGGSAAIVPLLEEVATCSSARSALAKSTGPSVPSGSDSPDMASGPASAPSGSLASSAQAESKTIAQRPRERSARETEEERFMRRVPIKSGCSDDEPRAGGLRDRAGAYRKSALQQGKIPPDPRPGAR